jgi:hypothetical protein
MIDKRCWGNFSIMTICPTCRNPFTMFAITMTG